MTCIDVSLPMDWEMLSQEELRFVLRSMVRFSDSNSRWRRVAAVLFYRRAGIKPVCRYGSNWLCRVNGKMEVVDAQQMADAVSRLSWLSEIPKVPVRLEKVGRKSVALPAFPIDVITFSDWLALENLFQGYVYTMEESILQEMSQFLYKPVPRALKHFELIGVFYWWSAVKAKVAAMFPSFFSPAPVQEAAEPDYDSLRKSVDSQIRALTKGDVSKEDTVLNLPAIRALTELDAQAAEYEELQRKYPKSL